jgi:hypothetical protein
MHSIEIIYKFKDQITMGNCLNLENIIIINKFLMIYFSKLNSKLLELGFTFSS